MVFRPGAKGENETKHKSFSIAGMTLLLSFSPLRIATTVRSHFIFRFASQVVHQPTVAPSAITDYGGRRKKINSAGDSELRMKDISTQVEAQRTAIASGRIFVGRALLQQVLEDSTNSHTMLTAAKLAGISAAKQTHSIIPLRHAMPLSTVDVQISPNHEDECLDIEATAVAHFKTGAELEALHAVSVCALVIYETLRSTKGHRMRIEKIRLLERRTRHA